MIRTLNEKYDTTWRTETVGEWSFEMLQLVDFEAAVDKLIDFLQLTGRDDIQPEDCPYFGQIWSASRTLATAIVNMDLSGKRSLEVGCGLALPSLVAAKKGAKCTAVDIHPDVHEFIQETLIRNKLGASLEFQQTNWREYTAPEPFDLILGSDILYENQHPDDIIHFLQRNLKGSGQAIIVDPCRWHHQEFAKKLESKGFHVEGVYTTVNEKERVVKIYTMTIRCAQSN